MGNAYAVSKIVTRATLNTVLPGAGSVVDFIEGCVNLRQGEYSKALCNFGCGVLEIVTLGIASSKNDKAAKEAAKQTGDIAKELFIKEVAKGVVKDIVIPKGREFAAAY